MAEITSAVGNYLRNKSSVTDLVVSSRIYWSSRPRNPTLPYILVTEIDADSQEHLGGSSGLTTDRVQIECVDDTELDADAIREAVRLVLQGYRGTMTGKTVKGIAHGGASQIHSYPKVNRDDEEFNKVIDFLISYAEAVPS